LFFIVEPNEKSPLPTFFLLSFQIYAQNLSLYGVSPSYSQMGKLSGKLNYSLNVTSVVNVLDQTIEGKSFPATHTHLVMQGLLSYQFNKKFSLAAGYGYGRHNIFGLRENEPRFLAQASFQHKIGNFIMTNRGRYELRYPINLNTQMRSKADILRYQTWLTYPLYDTKRQKQGFFLSASNELFLYLSGAKNGPVSSKNGPLWAENWSHLGGGYNAGSTRFELGYCFQTLVRNKAQDHRYFNLLQLNIYHTINWDDVQSWWYL
jgi:Protein of unknown function (DUF2490)